ARTLVTGNVDEAIVVHPIPRRREADDEPIGMPRELALVHITHAGVEIVRALLQELKDGMPQILVAVARRHLDAPSAKIEHGAIREAIQIEVALLPPREIARVGLLGIVRELRLRDRTRQLRV